MGEKLCFALLQRLSRKMGAACNLGRNAKEKQCLFSCLLMDLGKGFSFLPDSPPPLPRPPAHSKGRWGVGEGGKLLRFNVCGIWKGEWAHGRIKAALRLVGDAGQQDSPGKNGICKCCCFLFCCGVGIVVQSCTPLLRLPCIISCSHGFLNWGCPGAGN